ncbi:unnamed protein product [Psylliodes chrysocephalus]|uniref:Protein sleepless n=1 Tax=Psylliodes chrysocephalus TaxID=3402493 RepID=A0A9P0CXC0_9CUCU|nr:unnamed protein product [Psylliodes chrysocephala]
MWKVYGSVMVLFMVGVNTVYSVKCYSCLANHNYEDCAKPDLSQISLVKCDMTALQQTREFAQHIDHSYHKLFEVDSIDAEPGRIGMACLKMITRVGGKDYFLRGCQLAEQGNLDICNKVKEKNNGLVQTVSCVKCTSEGCNSSSEFKANAFLAIFATLITRLIFSIV